MKLHAVLNAILATSLAMGGPAFAQGEGHQQERNTQRHDQRGDRQQAQRKVQQQQQQRAWAQQRGNQQRDEHRDARGAGPDHEFHRGDRLPPEYRHRSYVVDDWRGHRLSAPPRGYHWVQVGGDYVLVAIATGVIMQLLLNN
jgi:Ni/Co efflux regulator RcnB